MMPSTKIAQMVPLCQTIGLPELDEKSPPEPPVQIQNNFTNVPSERSGSVIEFLTRDRRAAGSSLTGVTVLCP